MYDTRYNDETAKDTSELKQQNNIICTVTAVYQEVLSLEVNHQISSCRDILVATF